MLVKSILIYPPTTVEPDTSIMSVSSLMLCENTGAVLIVDKDRLVGIITDRDIVIRLGPCCACALTQPISEIMTPDPLTCQEDHAIVDAAAIMADNQIRCLPVLDHARDLVGLLTVDLIAEHYSELLAGETLGEIVEKRLRSPLRC